MKRMLWIFGVLTVLCMSFGAQAQVIWHDPASLVEVRSATLQGEEWLFLPSGSDLTALLLEHDGQTSLVDWTAAGAENEAFSGIVSGVWQGETLHVAVSQNLRSLHLQSSDPENQGRLWLEDSLYHERSTAARLVMLEADGSADFVLNIPELRGRGNSSWRMASRRRPYQYMLEDRMDLLKTGLRHEYCRTWVLLTNDDDFTLMRNQLGLDIAKELGLESTSRCEQVDLYYDGDYRGTYLLAEKLEVGEHGVDVMDFDRLLEPINELLRAPNPDLLENPLVNGVHMPTGESEYGSYACIPGVYDNRDVDAGGYLLELDSDSTMSERAWFSLPDGKYVAVKNPEYASDTMIRHLQSIFLPAYEAMLNHGYHPVTDEPLEAFIDIDSFTRSHLVQELLHNSNAYYFSSTFFVVPQGESRLYAGPVWDFDHIADTPAPGLKDNNILSHAFYRTTVFQRAAKQICQNEIKPMLENTLFGDANGKYLKPLRAYRETISASWQMNYYRFFGDIYGYENAAGRFEDTMDALESFMREQSEFLMEEIFAWGEDEPTHSAEIFFELPYANPQKPTVCELVGEQYGSVLLDTQFTCVEPATEEEWGQWQVSFIVRAKPHCTLPQDIAISINGTEYPVRVKDNKAILTFEYENPYYRPAVADGVDYGNLFDYDWYTDMHPELLEEDLTREDVIRHFRDEGMAAGEMANEYFDPLLIFDTMYDVCEELGENWPLYYQQYLTRYPSWSQELGFVYEPDWIQLNEGE